MHPPLLRLFPVVVALAVALSALAGCGSASDSTGGSTSSPAGGSLRVIDATVEVQVAGTAGASNEEGGGDY